MPQREDDHAKLPCQDEEDAVPGDAVDRNEDGVVRCPSGGQGEEAGD
jgi:hypothetical protein